MSEHWKTTLLSHQCILEYISKNEAAYLLLSFPLCVPKPKLSLNPVQSLFQLQLYTKLLCAELSPIDSPHSKSFFNLRRQLLRCQAARFRRHTGNHKFRRALFGEGCAAYYSQTWRACSMVAPGPVLDLEKCSETALPHFAEYHGRTAMLMFEVLGCLPNSSEC